MRGLSKPSQSLRCAAVMAIISRPDFRVGYGEVVAGFLGEYSHIRRKLRSAAV